MAKPYLCKLYRLHWQKWTTSTLPTLPTLPVNKATYNCCSELVSINKINLHWTRLVLRWVTVSGFNSRYGTFISVCNPPPRSTQSGHPFVGRRNEYQPKGADTLRLGVKAGMVRVWMAGKTVWFHCYTRAISEHFRDKGLIYKALYKFICLLYLYFIIWLQYETEILKLYCISYLQKVHDVSIGTGANPGLSSWLGDLLRYLVIM